MSSTATKSGENAPPPPPPPPLPQSQTSMAGQMNPMLQAQYQQYYQYMQYYSMYQPALMAAAYQQQQQHMSSAAASSSSNAAVASASMQSYYNYGQQYKPPPTKPEQSKQTTPTAAAAAPIKINLKFQQQNSPSSLEGNARKASRFSSQAPYSNVVEQQNQYKQEQQAVASSKPPSTAGVSPVSKAQSTPTASSASTDIVYDIQKWPAALKQYCTKVYQSFNFVKTPAVVTEDQVTKYLQQRITEAFKLKPDLSIDWQSEPVPTVDMVRRAVPAPPKPQVNQAAVKAAKLAANQVMARKFAAATPVGNQLHHAKTNSSLETKKTAATASPASSSSSSRSSSSEAARGKRKHRSRSVSSSSSRSSRSSRSSSRRSSSRSRSGSSRSESDQNYIALTNAHKVKDNLNKKFNKATTLGQRELDAKKNQITKKDPYSYSQSQSQYDNLNAGARSNTADVWGSGKKNKKFKKAKQQRQAALNRKIFVDSPSGPRKPFRSIFALARELDKPADQMDTSDLVCIGTSQDLEKEYLRLTGPPDSSMVRPLHVLRRSLAHVLREYERTKNYRYICDQMKAIRQDLTVQMIRNEFTVQVYEAHARIAIRNGDRDEFNQCQSQLKSLYDLIEKNLTQPPLSSEQQQKAAAHSAEFVGYRLVYNMLTKSINDQSQIIKEIKRKYASDAYLAHLLELRRAWHLNNYVKFFKLYQKCNELTKSLISLFVERERKNALKVIIKAYRPSIRLENVCEFLAYESLEACRTDLIEKYKLSVQASGEETSATGGDATTTTTKMTPTMSSKLLTGGSGGSFLIKTSSTGLGGRTVIADSSSSSPKELILDCKSCNAQNL